MQFLNKLKAKSIRSAVAQLIVALIGCGALAAVLSYVFGAHQLITGPQDLMSLSGPDVYGAYVYMDTDYVPAAYAYTGASLDEAKSKEYIALLPDESGFVGLLVYKGDIDKYEAQFNDQLQGYASGAYTDERPAPFVRITGTVRPMDAETISFFSEILYEDLGYPSGSGYHYYIEVNRLDGIPYWVFYAVAGAMVLVVLFSIFKLVRAVSGGAQKSVRALAEARGGEDWLDKTFLEAPVLDKRLWMNPEGFVYHQKTKTLGYDMRDVVWAFKRTTRTNGIATDHSLLLNTAGNKSHSISLKNKSVDESMDYLMLHCPWVAIGHTPEISRLYKQNPDMLRETAAQQRAGAAAADAAASASFAQPAVTDQDNVQLPL